jgi:hypothetical protein
MQGGAAAKAHKLKMEAHASELAAHALDRVRTKLLSTTSVEYTVNELIRIATDPANLATIYHGQWTSARSMLATLSRNNPSSGTWLIENLH